MLYIYIYTLQYRYKIFFKLDLYSEQWNDWKSIHTFTGTAMPNVITFRQSEISDFIHVKDVINSSNKTQKETAPKN